MKERSFVYDKSFHKQFKKLVKNNHDLEKKVLTILNLMKKDIFDERLYTHKLSGVLKKYYSCRVSFDIRILFYFDNDFVYLIDIGNHDSVY